MASRRLHKLERSEATMDLPSLIDPPPVRKQKKPAKRVGRPPKYQTEEEEKAAIRAKHLRQAEEKAAREFAKTHDPARILQKKLKCVSLSISRAEARIKKKQEEFAAQSAALAARLAAKQTERAELERELQEMQEMAAAE